MNCQFIIYTTYYSMLAVNRNVKQHKVQLTLNTLTYSPHLGIISIAGRICICGSAACDPMTNAQYYSLASLLEIVAAVAATSESLARRCVRIPEINRTPGWNHFSFSLQPPQTNFGKIAKCFNIWKYGGGENNLCISAPSICRPL